MRDIDCSLTTTHTRICTSKNTCTNIFTHTNTRIHSDAFTHTRHTFTCTCTEKARIHAHKLMLTSFIPALRLTVEVAVVRAGELRVPFCAQAFSDNVRMLTTTTQQSCTKHSSHTHALRQNRKFTQKDTSTVIMHAHGCYTELYHTCR